MTTATLLLFAMILDAALGEPRWLWQRLPHPAILMGRLISWCDQRFNSGNRRKEKGVVTVVSLVLLGAALGFLLSGFGHVVEIICAAILLAHRSLVQHVSAVADGLGLSLAQGRRAVSMIVSRDTNAMTESSVARSAIESAAENMSDGVIAPAFWFLVGGLPGLLIYKFVNTADSMIGYRTSRHADFGWAAARLDDLLNLIPARLTALLIAIPGGALGQWSEISADAKHHKSPNAGWPEAAMARAINIALAGPRSYDGVTQDFDWVNENGAKTLTAFDIHATVGKLWQAWVVMLGLAFVLSLFLG